MDCWPGAAWLAAELRAGRCSSSAAVEAYIARIERHDGGSGDGGGINAVVVRDFGRARARAVAADAAAARGEWWGPLHGVPLTVKENLDVAGLPTTKGEPMRVGALVATDEPVIARLLGAGAVVLGKTNLQLEANDVQVHRGPSTTVTDMSSW